MREYTINFIIWFYYYKVRDFAFYVRTKFMFMLIFTRTLPMITNIYRPLFGDKTKLGYLIGFFIRFWWALLGGIISIIYIIPFVITLGLFVILPVVPVVIIYRFVSP